MTDAALQSYVDKWLAAQPAQRLALVFIDPPSRDAAAALAALELEWTAAALGVREAQVAASKLQWWAEELAGAAASGGRHPLVRTAFAAPTARRVPGERWLAPVLAALARLDVGTPADFDAQLQQAEPFNGALGALETAWWFGPDADPTRAARMATLGHVLRMLSWLDRDAMIERLPLPLPMARLARHALDRDGLRTDSTARRDAVRAQLADIAAAWHQAWRLPGPLGPFRGLDARLGARLARRAATAADPLAVLRAGWAGTGGPPTVLRAWAAARAWRRDAHAPSI